VGTRDIGAHGGRQYGQPAQPRDSGQLRLRVRWTARWGRAGGTMGALDPGR